MVDANVKIIEVLKSFLNTVIEDPEIRELFTINPKDFIRDRKLPLKKIIVLFINLPKRSLNIELQSFFEALDQESLCCTMKVESNYSHTLSGVFWFDLPLGILLAFIFTISFVINCLTTYQNF